MENIENKKKREPAEMFIGWKSEDGKLEVIGIHQESVNGKVATFKVTCTECSKDPELFPDGYFISTKGHLKSGRKPCGCSKKPEWFDWQYLILARRAGEGKFIVHGFAEEFHGHKTKLNLECLKDGTKWVASIDNTVIGGRGCPKCGAESRKQKRKIPEYNALQKCIEICKEMNYDVVGFVDGYLGTTKTRFEYICPKHGKQNVTYSNFVNKGSRCKSCHRDKQKQLRNGNGYFPERISETDYLYVLNFNHNFLKVGRSFDVDERMKSLRTESKVPKKNIYKLRIFTATHQEIYDLEQELHTELRERNFQHYVDWSTECFENDSLFVLNKLLDGCGLQEASI